MQGFGVSGVPQLFGERVAGTGTAAGIGCVSAGRARKPAASRIEPKKGIYPPEGFEGPYIAAYGASFL